MADDFGTLLVSRGLVTDAQLREAIAHQQFTGNRVAEALLALGHVTPQTLHELMSEVRPVPLGRKLGEVLVENGAITRASLDSALALQQKTPRPLGEILLERGDCTYQQVYEALDEQQRPAPHANARVVVIDDSELACTLIAEGLRALDYHVTAFTDPFAALAQIDELKPDLVVTDLNMPGITGDKIVQRLSVPAIILTADESESAIVGLQAGAEDYIKKGTSIEELAARIDAIVRRTTATQRIKKLFARYTSDAVVDQVLASGDVVLTGEKREVSVLFADIRNFTGLAESLEPEQVMSIVNDVLGRLADAVLGCGGTIDKFLGDGLMALFGAPTTRPDDARWAVESARHMMRAIAERNASVKDGTPKLEIGIGLNTGMVVCGSLGNERRTEYTVIGDAVNVAARLCALAEPGEILVGEGTVDRVGDRARFLALEPVKLKGKKEPVWVYRVTS